MDLALQPFVLVVIAGPQASGKSATATALSSALRGRGESVALVELDQIAAMALPSLLDWETAHRITEVVTGEWARSGMTCVITEGTQSRDKIKRLLRQAPPGTAALTVVTTAPFEIAFSRAEGDRTRGVSREHDFLHAVYERWAKELAQIDRDLLLDTSVLTIDESVATILEAIDGARRQQRLSH